MMNIKNKDMKILNKTRALRNVINFLIMVFLGFLLSDLVSLGFWNITKLFKNSADTQHKGKEFLFKYF